jgi:hypothetical protein
MIREILQSIEGVAAYPVVSLIVFVIGFLSVLYGVWRMPQAEVERVSRLPLDDAWPNTEDRHGQI